LILDLNSDFCVSKNCTERLRRRRGCAEQKLAKQAEKKEASAAGIFLNWAYEIEVFNLTPSAQ
jgi:hypothetical protein